MNDYLIPLENETFDEYRLRVYRMKQVGTINMTWTEISDMFEDIFGVYKDESTWRKEAKRMLMSNVESITSEEENIKDDLKDLILEYKKERIKLADERTQNNAYIRRLAREDSIIEIAKYAVDQMSGKKFLKECRLTNKTRTNREAIIQISDWHYGIEVNNFINKFDTSICIERIQKLLDEAKEYFSHNPVDKIYVTNLGDLIAGRIHSTIRLQSRIDVITQCLHISEILAEFLNELSECAPIEYYDCLDNHSRLEPNKSESLDLETLARIIPWHLKYRFEDNDRINVNTNVVDDDIMTFKVFNGKYCVGGVHGHKDKPNRVVENLTLMTKIKFDLILSAHFHHFSADEKNETLVVSNGSLMGVDKYAMDLRLTSKPSQNIILIDEKSVLADIHRVVLD